MAGPDSYYKHTINMLSTTISVVVYTIRRSVFRVFPKATTSLNGVSMSRVETAQLMLPSYPQAVHDE